MVGITNKIMLAEIRRQQQLSQNIVDGQTAISTGVTLNKPSDDALAWVQLSDVGRAQAQQSAWQTNISYGKTRAANAEANLDEVNNLLTRAQELVSSSRNGSVNDTSRVAIYEEMSTIRATISELLNQTDYQGVSVFDDQQSVLVPVSRGLNLAVVATRQEVSEGIDVNGTPMSIDDMLGQSIAALQSGDDDAVAASLDAMKIGQNHITVELARQGVRSNRLDVVGDRLTDIDLDLTERRSALESTDLTEVISNVKAQLMQLEAAQSAFARINQRTLFDLIS
ncbi:MAG: flagellin [Sphingobium sp.]|uniref:Flagellar hook-associated protein 3 FlgL n=1 Tax=Sphingobium xenophagum TaxID=121428 RepID=A0A249MQK6_SPHXE|nr:MULTISPECIES: flagellin [Sphingobium]MBU0659777.1 flagellin [Alphaproteobacteria bacterium]ASY43582.1 flagellin [Sphingobium xenophagum]MBA4753381.1 flagellin [Sphingobium sp.]MBG6117805.1 flagellar hook-associated protein 3 FlgL [Sphingobium sp. JAI105]MBS88768.1 flagellin [Sphingobium sp.]|tara:strand:- start:4226 stop:5071 length:846 start_codon:yes stop_codon:yes gene_type:complete